MTAFKQASLVPTIFMKRKGDFFGKYSSKVKRVNIPIPSFEYVHKSLFSDRLGSPSPGFMIGRDRIIEKLKTWLTKEKTDGGSYLITGYRGMGKTSFVDRVLYELVGEPNLGANLAGVTIFFALNILGLLLFKEKQAQLFHVLVISALVLILLCICKSFLLKAKYRKYRYRIEVFLRYIRGRKEKISLSRRMSAMAKMWKGLSSKEWDRINHLLYGANVKEKRYSHISVSINLGQEILDERSILCVLTCELYNKYKSYVLSPIANVEMWGVCTLALVGSMTVMSNCIEYEKYEGILSFLNMREYLIPVLVALIALYILEWHQIHVLLSLKTLRKRIDAEMKTGNGLNVSYKDMNWGTSMEYAYPIANTRDIESQLITILDRIAHFPVHPTFYFVFDELDKIETPQKKGGDDLPEFSNEKYLSSGGTSRKRKFSVMHLLANMKYFTTTAKAKFLFIAGREMYDGYLADLTDRESAISSLFNGVIYVESFCKNEKNEKDVMYNTETFISRQLVPRGFIEEKVMDRFIECKLNGTVYTNPDINLKTYFQYLTLVYTENVMGADMAQEKKARLFDDARAAIDKTIGLLYHFTVYLYHVSNGSPKKMRQTFENLVRPLRNRKEFLLSSNCEDITPLSGNDIDIYIPERCKYLLSFGMKEQRMIGFIHYISFPVNQIITDADQFGDKLLVSACFLINHLYKYHSGGFSWRNIEQTPELLEVYKIAEFRGFIGSILRYLMQTHIIQIPCGLYQYKFRKQISEEISLASKVSEEVSAIFNFTLDESQAVKRHYVEMLERLVRTAGEEKISTPHAIAGIHHILGDLYLADEEYNPAIFEYQTAIQELKKVDTDNEDPHRATFTLAYIRNMLKLGTAFEKRRTYTSAYNTYNEIIDRLIRFREFDEETFGLNYVVQSSERWPHNRAVLYASRQNESNPIKKISPKPYNPDTMHNLSYKTAGKKMISDFSYQLTPEKHTVIQRLAMLEDTQIVYQALLAKLFINEKIELGGITRANLDVTEGEFQYIHLTANEKEKFLISTDFFRRLGDIMFYKNGMIGFNYSKDGSGCNLRESFVDTLYYWAFNIETELHDFCRANNCFEYFGILMKMCKKMTLEDIRILQDREMQELPQNMVMVLTDKKNGREREGSAFRKKDVCSKFLLFWNAPHRRKRLRRMPLKNIRKCNEKRKEFWEHNRVLPCYACKYYNRSLRIIMHNLFDVDAENVDDRSQKTESKTINIFRQIVLGGSAKSMRQNYMLQFAEVLDCLGNTTLSCSEIKEDELTSNFLAKFLHDVHEMNDKIDKPKDVRGFELLSKPNKNLTKVEICILYYWEASLCFRYGKEPKKAFGSMKKILRVIQNYLRVAEKVMEPEAKVKCKVRIGEFLNEIKNRIVKQCLLCLYSHYNYINIVEIQRLKWIFYTQMYENISLNRLSLFPDVEELMLIYYELIRLCIINEEEYMRLADDELSKTREDVVAYSRGMDKVSGFSWYTVKERDEDFNQRLIGIYNNTSMGTLRHENTVYERVLSLRMKTELNRYILGKAFPGMERMSHDRDIAVFFVRWLTHNPVEKSDSCWKEFFPDETFCADVDSIKRTVTDRLNLLEFLIRDSMYCLTTILETITPYTTSTLFTNSFIGSIYQSLGKWNMLFDALFEFYKFFDLRQQPVLNPGKDRMTEDYFKTYDRQCRTECPHSCHSMPEPQYWNQLQADDCISKMTMAWQSGCPFYRITDCHIKKNRFERFSEYIRSQLNEDEIEKTGNMYNAIFGCSNISDRFFSSILDTINKPNIQYTLVNYSKEMAIKSYRNAIELHREGNAYKEMISRMFYLDDDLKNDTVQFDLAMERFKINTDFIGSCITEVMDSLPDSLYDVENFCTDNESGASLSHRFPDRIWNTEEKTGLS